MKAISIAQQCVAVAGAKSALHQLPFPARLRHSGGVPPYLRLDFALLNMALLLKCATPMQLNREPIVWTKSYL